MSSTSSGSMYLLSSLCSATAPASESQASSRRASVSRSSVSLWMRSRSPGSTANWSLGSRSASDAASFLARSPSKRLRRSAMRSRTVILARSAAAARASDSSFCLASSSEYAVAETSATRSPVREGIKSIPGADLSGSTSATPSTKKVPSVDAETR
eukprot:scaffold83085_cov24-Tisochrysis_lutea.AAC.3